MPSEQHAAKRVAAALICTKLSMSHGASHLPQWLCATAPACVLVPMATTPHWCQWLPHLWAPMAACCYDVVLFQRVLKKCARPKKSVKGPAVSQGSLRNSVSEGFMGPYSKVSPFHANLMISSRGLPAAPAEMV